MKILLVVYDNDSYIHCFPLGLAYIASVLRGAGHSVTIYNQDMYHYPESHLVEYLNHNKFDLIGIGIIAGYYQYRKLLKLSEAINSSINRPFFVLGGHGPAPEPEYFLKKTKADVIVIGEGEITIVELSETLQNKKDLSSVKGIAYLDGGNLVVTPRRELIKDLDSIPYPAWDLFPMDYYALMRESHIKNSERCFYILGGRGCAFKCTFCYRMDKGLRMRSPESIIDEIKILQERYNISYISFIDELLMSSPRRTIELCEALIKADLKIRWCCFGRLNYVTPEVIKIMKKAGCVFISYGIEALDNEVLEKMNKKLTVEEIIRGIEATYAAGISPGLNIIFGNLGDTKETLKKGVDFLLKYDDHSQLRTIRPVTPYPGCPLYYYAIKEGLLKDVEDFYERKHINSDLLSVNFTDISDDEFHVCLLEANRTLLENYYKHKLQEQITVMEKLYLGKDATFRGFRHT